MQEPPPRESDFEFAVSIAQAMAALNQSIPPRQREAGAPHRYTVGTLLVITTVFAVLFAVLRLLQAPPEVLAFMGIFFAAVTAGQMFLFKGERPRRASVIVGALFYPLMGVAATVYEIVVHYDLPAPSPARFERLVLGALCSIPMGAVVGYLAGILIASAFLLIDKCRGRTDADAGEQSP